MTEQPDTANQIMDVAQRLMQVGGYNAFSYADIASEVGIRKASIHYHFPSKSDLGQQVMFRYRRASCFRLEQLDRLTDEPRQKLENYFRFYLDLLHKEGQICLVCMLAADLPTLPAVIGQEVQGFYQDQLTWLGDVLQLGQQQGVFKFKAPLEVEARVLLAGVHGSMLLARASGDLTWFETVVNRMLENLLV